MYTLDTNTIIYYLKDDPDAVTALREIFSQDTPLYISAVTEIELFGFPTLSDPEAEQIEALPGICLQRDRFNPPDFFGGE